MKMMKILAAAAVVGALAWVSTSTRVGAEDNTAREARDRVEIEALMWKYTRALDTGNAEAYAAVYTPDGQFGNGPNATKGRDALKKMITGVADRQKATEAKGEPRPPMYHMTMNEHVEFPDRDHARINAYWLTVFGAAGESAPLRVAAAGRSIDDLVRVNGKWLIKNRNVTPQD